MNHTNKYALSQWEKTDRILMEDFNSDNARLEAALAAHDTALTTKATQSDLTAEASARQKADSAETTARQQAVTAEAQARQQADTTLTNSINSEAQARQSADNAINAALALRGNCQIYTTSFTGVDSNGTYTSRTITFPHKPMLVLIHDGANLLIAVPEMRSYRIGTSVSNTASISWSGNSITFNIMNNVNTTYYVVALLNITQ